MLDEPAVPDELAFALARLRQSPSDDGAWRSIYRRLWPFVVAVAHRRVRDKGIAEDIAQDVFARIARYRPYDRIHEPEQFRAYVWRMAVNVANAYARSARRRKRGLQALWDWGARDPVAPEASDDRLVFEELLSLARDKVEPQDHALLGLLLEGRPLAEVASKLGLTYSAAGVRLHRLRHRLRKSLVS